MPTASVRTLISVAAAAIALLVVLDLGLRSVSSVSRPREVREGMIDLVASNPSTLVIGSSHARTFHVLGVELQERLLAPGPPLVAVPLENGKLVPYLWLLEHRVAPVIDERTSDGSRVRSNLRNFILLTEWWDSCNREDGLYWNLPSRAWTLGDYLRDVHENGLNAYNRNYIQSLLRMSLSGSILWADRTDPKLKDAIIRKIQAMPNSRTPEEEALFLERWRATAEIGSNCVGAPEQIAALRGIVKFARDRDLDTTVVLFPRKPATLTQTARSTTIARYRNMVESIVTQQGVKLVDLTTSSPLGDQDFMADFDHVNAEGNLKFAHWALENDFRYLLEQQAPGRPWKNGEALR